MVCGRENYNSKKGKPAKFCRYKKEYLPFLDEWPGLLFIAEFFLHFTAVTERKVPF